VIIGYSRYAVVNIEETVLKLAERKRSGNISPNLGELAP
jgi:hypothetical protein